MIVLSSLIFFSFSLFICSFVCSFIRVSNNGIQHNEKLLSVHFDFFNGLCANFWQNFGVCTRTPCNVCIRVPSFYVSIFKRDFILTSEFDGIIRRLKSKENEWKSSERIRTRIYARMCMVRDVRTTSSENALTGKSWNITLMHCDQTWNCSVPHP